MSEQWLMPKWMEPFRQFIGNTGGNSVEDLIDRLHNEEGLSFSNSIVWGMASTVQSQVNLLEALHDAKLLWHLTSVDEQLPEDGSKVMVFGRNGTYYGEAEYYADIQPTRCNPDAIKGLKGFVQYGHDEMWFECSPTYWCEVPTNPRSDV